MGRDVPGDPADVPKEADAPGPGRWERGDGFVLTREFYAAHELASFRDDAELYDVRRVDEPGRMDCPADALERFSPDRAGLEEVTADEAKRHIKDNMADRPWLVTADSASPEVQRIFTALDRGQGHALERHEGAVTREATDARVTQLKDPAIAMEGDRTPGKDAYRSGLHGCGTDATRFNDPYAFATAFARGVEHPKVRTKLDVPFDPDGTPSAQKVPLSDLLGGKGHQWVDGNHLNEVDGSTTQAKKDRKSWVKSVRDGEPPTVSEPTARPVDSCEGWDVLFVFKPDFDKQRYEIATMYATRPEN